MEKLFINFRIIEADSRKKALEKIKLAHFTELHPCSDVVIPMPDSLDLKRTIIENFIDYCTTDEKERDLLKETLSDYIQNDHTNELEFLDGQKANG